MQKSIPANVRDLTGKVFGRLTVVGYENTLPNGRTQWKCLCECGEYSYPITSSLNGGTTVSCGCYRIQRIKEAQTTHGAKSGKKRTSEYRSWESAKRRCSNKSSPAYPDYGGRGIKVCERWCSFENFIADMGPKPTPKHTLDRINNDKGYEPGNCRWATRAEQSLNRRVNRLVSYQGKTLCIAEWSRELGMSRHVLARRLNLGWSAELAFTTPIRPYRSNATN